MRKMLDMISKKKIWVILILVFAIYLSFGSYHIDKFETADEHYWIYDYSCGGRIGQYWDAISNFKLGATYINDKPGVSLAFVSGLGKLIYPGGYDDLFSDHGYYRTYYPEKMRNILLFHRFPILIVNGLLSLLVFWLLRKYSKNEWLATWATIMIMLNPILVGISQIVNPDALLWIFSIIAILAFLDYLKYEEKKFASIASLFFGWALLTKYVALIIAVFFFIFLIIRLFHVALEQREVLRKKVLRFCLAYLGIIAGALALYALLFPAVLVNPKLFYAGTIGFGNMEMVFILLATGNALLIFDALIFKSKCLGFIFNLSGKLKSIFPRIIYISVIALLIFVIYNFGTDYSLDDQYKKIPFDDDRGLTFRNESIQDKTVLEVLPVVFSSVPIVLVFFLFSLIKTSIFTTKNSKLFFALVSALIIFYGAMVFQGLLADIRYSIITYPILAVLASIGMWEFSEWGIFKKIRKTYITGALIILGVASLWFSKPFYFNYTNFILPENILIADAWGYGGYEAAQYLNSLPDAENLSVWADYNGFCSFFRGKCIKGKADFRRFYENGNNGFDYYVKTRRGSMLYGSVWRMVGDLDGGPVWEKAINDRQKNYIRIYKAERETEELLSEHFLSNKKD